MAQQFRFRRQMEVGSIEAETDQMLNDVFVDAGDIAILTDTENPKSIIVGRTGTGKTALLLQMEEREKHRTIRIKPQALSLQYLSNSTHLPLLTDLDVHLDLFYKLLWHHILVVELLRQHYELRDRQKQESFFRTMIDFFQDRDQEKIRGLNYLEEWGDEFWNLPEERVRRVTEELDKRIEAAADVDLGAIGASIGASQGSKQTETEEIRSTAQEIVNSIQIKRLADAKRLIRDDVLNDPQKPYFLLIDDLDKAWVDTKFAYDLIAALIEVTGDFAKMQNVKVIIALREDIVHSIQERRSSKRQQREKQEVLFLRLRWHREELTELLDRRIRKIIRGQYGEDIGLSEILPKRPIGEKSAIQYMLERTFQRPRDLIAYMNYAIAEAINRRGITWSILRNVEPAYSRSRLNALEDEWNENFPGVKALFEIFRGMPDGFAVSEVDANDVLVPLQEAAAEGGENHVAYQLFSLWDEGAASESAIIEEMVSILFRVGVFGVSQKPGAPPIFSYEDPALLQVGLGKDAKVFFHPALYVALYVDEPAEAV